MRARGTFKRSNDRKPKKTNASRSESPLFVEIGAVVAARVAAAGARHTIGEEEEAAAAATTEEAADADVKTAKRRKAKEVVGTGKTITEAEVAAEGRRVKETAAEMVNITSK